MIILGDIASPDERTTSCLRDTLRQYPDVFKEKKIICNLEGLISAEGIPSWHKPVLINHPSVIEALTSGKPPLFCLANNHTLDLPARFDFTESLFSKRGIEYTGASRSMTRASAPAVFHEAGHEVVLYNACWDFLLYNHRNPRSGVYVAEINEQDLLGKVRDQKSLHPLSKVVVYFHWNFDLEILPFPMYRQFSRDLIDAGADLIVGCHSHCVQGGERYGNGTIVYGLGNFFIPHHLFIGGELVYPELSSLELALEWNPSTNDANCHWFQYKYKDGDHQLEYLKGESFEDSQILSSHSPFSGMEHGDYLKYFRQHRRKKLFIPVYADYQQRTRNRIFTMFIKGRAHFARSLAKMKLIKWSN